VLSQGPRPTDHAEASCGDGFVPHEVKANHGRRLAFVKVATDSIANALVQVGNFFQLREDRLSERARRITTFGRLFDNKDNLARQEFLACRIVSILRATTPSASSKYRRKFNPLDAIRRAKLRARKLRPKSRPHRILDLVPRKGHDTAFFERRNDGGHLAASELAAQM
jgi:hypothetical protein